MLTISYRPVAVRQPRPKRAPLFFPAILRTVQPDGEDYQIRAVKTLGGRYTTAESAIETAARHLSRRHLISDATWTDADEFTIIDPTDAITAATATTIATAAATAKTLAKSP